MNKYIIFKTTDFPIISETFVVHNVVESIKQGYKTTVIAHRKNSTSLSSQEGLLKQYAVLNKTVAYSEPKGKIKRKLIAFLLLLNPALVYYFFKYIHFKGKRSLSYLFLLNFYLPYRKANAFHVHFANAIQPLFELKEIGFLQSKIFITFHGYDAHFLPKGKFLDILLNQFSQWVDHSTVNSHFLKNKLVANGFQSKKIEVVPIGVDVGFFAPSNIGSPFKSVIKLITIARLVELKGVKYGIYTLKKLIEKGYEVTYTIVGDGPEKNNLIELVQDLKLDKNIRFLGKKTQIEIKELLETHQLFLMTSTIDKDGRREAFGVVSLEAQAMGLPVIGYNSGGFPETVIEGETCLLVADQDINAMAAAIEKLINNPGLRLQMSQQARQHVLENFSFENTIKKYLEMY